MIEPATTPLERVLGRELGGFYRDLHEERGVRMLLGRGVEAFEGDGVWQAVSVDDGTRGSATSSSSASA